MESESLLQLLGAAKFQIALFIKYFNFHTLPARVLPKWILLEG